MYVIMAMAVCRHSVGKSLDFSGFAMNQETVDKNVIVLLTLKCKTFYRLLIKIIDFYFPLFYYCLMTSAGGNVTLLSRGKIK